jgi:hypothetical protein
VVVENFQPLPLDKRSVPWTRTERLYGQLMEDAHHDDLLLPRPWHGLPMAQTNHIYSPYSLEQYNRLVDIHAEDELMLELISEVVSLER